MWGHIVAAWRRVWGGEKARVILNSDELCKKAYQSPPSFHHLLHPLRSCILTYARVRRKPGKLQTIVTR